MVCLGWLNNGPSSGSLLVLASRLSTRMLPCWSTLDFYIIATHLQPMVIPTPGPFLVRASRLLYENMAYRWWISWTSFASLLQCNSRRERRPLTTTPRFPSSVPSSRLANGSRDTNLAFTLFSSSTSESDGQLSSPQPVLVIVAGSFACLSSPCAPLPVSSLPCLSSDTVWLVLWLVTALQGPCQMFVLWESAGLALFRSLTVPLLGAVPSRCCRFTLLALVTVLWLLVVFCGTGWASTSIDNL